MTFFSCIEQNFNYVIQTCREKGQGYRLKLGDLSSHIILDGDRFSDTEKSCDCIILIIDDDQLVVVISELKSTVKSVDDIVKKMQNTAQLVKGMIERCNTDRLIVSFYPILVHKKGLKRSPLSQLKKDQNKIRLGARKDSIITMSSGKTLSDVIKRHKPSG